MPATPPEGSASIDGSAPATMPSYGIQRNLPVPSRLDMAGNISENWKKWKQVWDSFEITSRLNKQENKYGVATFITCIGSEALEVYHGLPFENEEDKHIMSKVMELMERHCIGQTNVIYEQYCFNNRKQESGESFDTYLTALRTLAKTCNFGSLTDELSRDRIVCGICDTGTRKKLLQEPKLTLQKCIDVCRSTETTATQMKVMNGNRKSTRSTAKKRKMATIRAIPRWSIASTAAEYTRDQEINAQRLEKNAQNVAKQITSPSYVDKSLVDENTERNGFIVSKTPKLRWIQATKSIASRFHSKIWKNKVSITSIVSPSNQKYSQRWRSRVNPFVFKSTVAQRVT